MSFFLGPAAVYKGFKTKKTNPFLVSYSYVSPRKRAQRTFELLNLGLPDNALPWKPHGIGACEGLHCDASIEVTEGIREWDYGDYEGVTSPDIRKLRSEQGYGATWDIWKDGCPGGE
jgi:probable phosphoglycerate mutase